MKQERMMAGGIIVESINFKFEVWAYRKLTDGELNFCWQNWKRQRDKRKSLKNKVVRVISNHGLDLRP
jgi:hypothetical protein